MSNLPRSVASQIASEVASKLAETKTSLVLAESCTAGLVSATLAEVPGISSWLCGSAVVYQESTKQQWLDIEKGTIEKHTAVSERVAREMVMGALAITSQADLAASVTGHLGPGAPPEQDGLIFVATGRRDDRLDDMNACSFRLASSDRRERQHEAAAIVLKEILESLGS